MDAPTARPTLAHDPGPAPRARARRGRGPPRPAVAPAPLAPPVGSRSSASTPLTSSRRAGPARGLDLDLALRALGVFRHALWLRIREWSLDMLLQDLPLRGTPASPPPGFTAVAVLDPRPRDRRHHDGLQLGRGPGAEPAAGRRRRRPAGRRPRHDPEHGPTCRCRIRTSSTCATTRRRASRASWPSASSRRRCAPTRRPSACGRRSSPATTSGSSASGPSAGRTFSTDEDVTPGGHPVVVLSHRFWQRRFQSSPVHRRPHDHAERARLHGDRRRRRRRSREPWSAWPATCSSR